MRTSVIIGQPKKTFNILSGRVVRDVQDESDFVLRINGAHTSGSGHLRHLLAKTIMHTDEMRVLSAAAWNAVYVHSRRLLT